MPELPEVETTCRGIAPHLEGKKVKSLTIRQYNLRWPIPSNMEELMKSHTLLKVYRRGKYILLAFNHGTAMIHLGMSGSMRVLDANVDVAKHDHFDIKFSNGKTLRYNDPRRFGSFLWAGENPLQHKLLASLGVEPLESDFHADYIYKASRNRKIAIKQFIMDSHLVVGVGNIYANEALFQAGIRPSRAANQVSLKRYQRLVDIIKVVLDKAIKQGGTTLKDFSQIDGKPGYFAQELQVYGRAGEQCLQCDEVLIEIRQSGRSSVFCKKCQH
ncbi:MAG: formamidopyrimidine-DNA glycosylase [Enterobacterales bacterium]|jgi:formamidopyrimidine-DNA glycosylase